jgi:transposase
MQMDNPVLGIDVAKDTLAVKLMSQERSADAQVANNLEGYQQLDAWLRKHASERAHVCLEATGQYGDGVAEYLHQQGYPVSVVNPARIKHYGNSKLRRNKTDQADAQLIAEYCQREQPTLWTPAPASFKSLQALVRHLDDLIQTRQQELNRMSSGVSNPFVIGSLRALITCLEEQITQTKQAIQTQIDQDPQLRHQQDLLVSITGIGKLTAARLLGEIRNIRDFQSARQLAAYAGLTPRNVFCGTSIHKKARLSKTGNANIRRILYMSAISAKRWNPIVHAFCQRLLANGKCPMQVIGAAMHKLLHLAYGVLKTDRPFDPDYLVKVQANP